MKSPLLLLPAFLLILLSGCNTVVSPSISGKWTVSENGKTEAILVLGPGDVFQADLPAADGVEVKGILRKQGREITFVNQSGTDAISSNPEPGVYMYQLDGDKLTFSKISDPIPRRAKFLAKTWTRASAD